MREGQYSKDERKRRLWLSSIFKEWAEIAKFGERLKKKEVLDSQREAMLQNIIDSKDIGMINKRDKTDHYSYNELKKDKKDLAKGKWAGNKMLNAVHVNVPKKAKKLVETGPMSRNADLLSKIMQRGKEKLEHRRSFVDPEDAEANPEAPAPRRRRGSGDDSADEPIHLPEDGKGDFLRKFRRTKSTNSIEEKEKDKDAIMQLIDSESQRSYTDVPALSPSFSVLYVKRVLHKHKFDLNLGAEVRAKFLDNHVRDMDLFNAEPEIDFEGFVGFCLGAPRVIVPAADQDREGYAVDAWKRFGKFRSTAGTLSFEQFVDVLAQARDLARELERQGQQLAYEGLDLLQKVKMLRDAGSGSSDGRGGWKVGRWTADTNRDARRHPALAPGEAKDLGGWLGHGPGRAGSKDSR
jgi:hypothetical protein